MNATYNGIGCIVTSWRGVDLQWLSFRWKWKTVVPLTGVEFDHRSILNMKHVPSSFRNLNEKLTDIKSSVSIADIQVFSCSVLSSCLFRSMREVHAFFKLYRCEASILFREAFTAVSSSLKTLSNNYVLNIIWNFDRGTFWLTPPCSWVNYDHYWDLLKKGIAFQISCFTGIY